MLLILREVRSRLMHHGELTGQLSRIGKMTFELLCELFLIYTIILFAI